MSEESELIPVKDGLVESDELVALTVDGFSEPYLYKAWNSEHTYKVEGSSITVKEAYGMTKACFIEEQVGEYHFKQWKGTFTKVADLLLVHPDYSRRYGWPVEMTDKSNGIEIGLPLMEFKHKDAEPYVRFVGGAYMEDLLHEAEKTKQLQELTGGILRTPEIIETIPLSNELAEKLNLPLQGESESEYKERIGLSSEVVFEKYEQIGLGQNIRRFRTIWRVMDIELMLKAHKNGSDEIKKQVESDLRDIFETTAKIFSAEFITPVEADRVCIWFAQIVGEQAGQLVGNNIIHGALGGHFHDITLAGEICDFDQTLTLDEALEEYKHEHGTDLERVAEQEVYLKMKCFRQLYLIAGHIGPIFEASMLLYPDDHKTMRDIAELFSNGLSKAISGKIEVWNDVKERSEKYIDDTDAGKSILEDIAKFKSQDEMDIDQILINKFSNQSEFFGEIVNALNNIFSIKAVGSEIE